MGKSGEFVAEFELVEMNSWFCGEVNFKCSNVSGTPRQSGGLE